MWWKSWWMLLQNLDSVGKRINHRNSYATQKWFKNVVTYFFLENAKTLGRSDDAKRMKKRMALTQAMGLPPSD